ncbi:hypothetical protein MPTK1_3g10375 [Marchantia polymorpha subsp. ruderalis]
MVELEEIDEPCAAKARALILQKRFQGLITNIIKDTQETFSSMMDELDTDRSPMRKLPSLLHESSGRFHCQMVRNSWKRPKPEYASPESPGRSCGSLDTPSLSSSGLDDYEPSERLQSLIEEELRSRKEIATSRERVHYAPTRPCVHWDSDCDSDPSSSTSSWKTSRTVLDVLGDEKPSSSQRLNFLIQEELNRMKIKVEQPKDHARRGGHSWATSYSAMEFTPKSKHWTDPLGTTPSEQSQSKWLRGLNRF